MFCIIITLGNAFVRYISIGTYYTKCISIGNKSHDRQKNILFNCDDDDGMIRGIRIIRRLNALVYTQGGVVGYISIILCI